MVPNSGQDERHFRKGADISQLDKISGNTNILKIKNNSSSKTAKKQAQSRNVFNKGLDTKELHNVINDLEELGQNQSLQELLVVQKAEMKQRHNSMPELEDLPQDFASYATAGDKLMSKKLARQRSLKQMRSTMRKSIMTKDEQIVFWMRK